MARRSAIIHEKTTNNTDPKGRIHIPYEVNHQYMKFHPKIYEVYPLLSNACEDIILGMHY